jgi:hypothetical protein
MGIGAPRDLQKALVCAVEAGLRGSIPGILTSVALFDTLRATTNYEFNLNPRVLSEIERWVNGDLTSSLGEELITVQDYEMNSMVCRLTIHETFSMTPAARHVLRRYPAIRDAIGLCSCISRPSDGVKGKQTRTICGWELLKEIKENLQSLRLAEGTHSGNVGIITSMGLVTFRHFVK